MIFQDPLSSLTPVFNVGEQIVEVIQCHSSMSKSDAGKRAIELLDMVGIPEPHKRVKAFPHEFSGGMRQRVVIAIAIANNPRILIADEPTTALDVTVQAQILDLIKVARRETGAATIMITHDMGVVAETADDVLVMYAGRPVEHANMPSIFHNPKMPYTIGLLESTPRVDKQAEGALPTIPGHPPMLIDLPQGCPFATRCPVVVDKCREKEPLAIPLDNDPNHNTACFRSHEIVDQRIDNTRMYPPPVLADDILAGKPRSERSTVLSVTNLRKEFPLLKGALVKRRVGTVHAVRGVDIDIKQGECFAIVGESGSGKTTTLIEIIDLNPPEGTAIELCGESAARFTRKSRLKARQNIQIVFQDPMGSLNPRMTVREIITEPLKSLGFDGDVNERVTELMKLVGLNAAHIDRFPSAFSGGQRQRIGLARALATNPALIVLDEPVSALDVSIQAGMINLLDDLKRRLGLSYLFVAHDLSVVRHISDRVAVMYQGEFVEQGNTDDIFDNPQHPYAKKLLAAIPIPEPHAARDRSVHPVDAK